jgi:hypothetical protein
MDSKPTLSIRRLKSAFDQFLGSHATQLDSATYQTASESVHLDGNPQTLHIREGRVPLKCLPGPRSPETAFEEIRSGKARRRGVMDSKATSRASSR